MPAISSAPRLFPAPAILALLALTQAAADTGPVFKRDVAPVLYRNCAKCHAPGEIASGFPLLSYDDARPRAKAIKAKVLAREMPPWSADPAASLKFRNDARLSQRDIDIIAAWVNAGA